MAAACVRFYLVAARERLCPRARTEALAARVSEAKRAEASARADLSVADGSVASLEQALSAAEAEKAEVVKRLTRKGGDYVAVSGVVVVVVLCHPSFFDIFFVFSVFGS